MNTWHISYWLKDKEVTKIIQVLESDSNCSVKFAKRKKKSNSCHNYILMYVTKK